MTNDLDALPAALHAKIDDEMTGTRWLGRPPRLADSELVRLAVAQAVLGFTSESRWPRFVSSRLDNHGWLAPAATSAPPRNRRKPNSSPWLSDTT